MQWHKDDVCIPNLVLIWLMVEELALLISVQHSLFQKGVEVSHHFEMKVNFPIPCRDSQIKCVLVYQSRRTRTPVSGLFLFQ